MKKSNALIFVFAVLFLCFFGIQAGWNVQQNTGSFGLLSQITDFYYNKIVRPAAAFSQNDTVNATAICLNGKELAILENETAAKQVVDEFTLYLSSLTDGTLLSAVPKGTLSYKTAPYSKSRITAPVAALRLLKGYPTDSGYYTLRDGDTAASVSAKFSLSESVLALLNPDIQFKSGDRVLITVPIPTLSLTLTKEVVYTETVPIEYVYEYDPTLKTGERKIAQQGQVGSYEICAHVTYENYTEIGREIKSKTIVTEPKQQIIKMGTKPPLASGRFIRPVSGGSVTSPFGERERDNHQGIDIGLDQGSPIHAADGGTVTTAGWVEGYGNTVIIDHGNGFSTLYGHCDTVSVSPSQTVLQGEEIARVGSTGISTGPHLHFEIRENGIPVDPSAYFAE